MMVSVCAFPAQAVALSEGESIEIDNSTSFVNDSSLYVAENLVSADQNAIVFERDVPLAIPLYRDNSDVVLYQRECVALIPKADIDADDIVAEVLAGAWGEHPMETIDSSLSCRLYSTFSYAIRSGVSVWDYYYFTSPITGGYTMVDPSGTVVESHYAHISATGADYLAAGLIVQEKDSPIYDGSQKTWSINAPSSWLAVASSDLGGVFGVNYFVTLKRTASGYTWEASLINHCF